MANLAPVLRQRFFDADGKPLAGGKLWSYAAGTGFAVLKDTYTTQAGTVANTNPVVLDADGEADIWLGAGAYDFRVFDASNVLQFTTLNVSVDPSAFQGPITLQSLDNTAARIDMITLTRGNGSGDKLRLATIGNTLNGVAAGVLLIGAVEVMRATAALTSFSVPTEFQANATLRNADNTANEFTQQTFARGTGVGNTYTWRTTGDTANGAASLRLYNGVSGALTFTGVNATFGNNVNINGNTVLGDAAGDSLTINGTAVSIPNNLNIGAGKFFFDNVNIRLGVGTAAPSAAAANYGSVDIRGTSGGGVIYGVAGGFNVSTYATGTTVDYVLSANGSFRWFNTAQSMTLDSNGNLLVGSTSGANHIIARNAGQGGTVIGFFGNTGNASLIVQSIAAQGWNAANAAIWVGRDSVNSRSINAGGTINASGADYAEYMVKSALCGTIIKGQIVGIDATGKITDNLANAHSYAIKSTNPAYVGGDDWGSDIEDEDELEAARATVDRVAFSGRVPVNVTGAQPGDYIVADNGGEIWDVQADHSVPAWFKKYLRATGKVWAVLDDGRAYVNVLHN